MSNILLMKEVTKVYHGNTGVKHISLAIPRRGVYGLLGPNGAGKSTLLKIITGRIQPTSGQIWYDDEPWQRKHLKKIGSLIEQPAIYPNLTALENLQVYATLLGVEEVRCHQVLTTVGLTATNKKIVKHFSLGMQQRLGVAVALLNQPELLILDEPTNGLDPLAIQELRTFIRELVENGVTIILSSHILSEVAQVADTIGILANGQLLYQAKNRADIDLEQLFIETIIKSEANKEAE